MPYRRETAETLRRRLETIEARLSASRHELQDALEEIARLRDRQNRALLILRTTDSRNGVEQAIEALRQPLEH